MNGADRLCDVLLANHVDVCFANPGTSEMHFVAALDRMMSLTDPAPDWVKLAEGFGVEAVSVRTCDAFSDTLASALRHRGPFLIECTI